MYGAIYLAGLVVFCETLRRSLLRQGIVGRNAAAPNRRWLCIELSTLYLVSMLLGARLLYGLVHWTEPVGQWGGYAVLIIVVTLWLRFRPLPRGAILDAIAVAVPASMVVSKLACVVTGCCHGRPTDLPWGVLYTSSTHAPNGMPLHPTQAYDMLVFLLAALSVLALQRFRLVEGKLILVSVAVMAAGRFVTEFFRGDERVLVARYLSLTQAVVLICFVFAVAFLGVPRFRRLWDRTLVPVSDKSVFLERINESDQRLQSEFGADTRAVSRLRLLGESLLMYVVAVFCVWASIGILVVAILELRKRGYTSELQSFVQRNGLRSWAMLSGVSNLGAALVFLLAPSPLMLGAQRAESTLPGLVMAMILGGLVLMGSLGIALLVVSRALSRALPERFSRLRREGLV